MTWRPSMWRIARHPAAVLAAGLLAAAGARTRLVAASPQAPLATCAASGWQRVGLPQGLIVSSLAVDPAPGRQRLYAGTHTPGGSAVNPQASVWAVGLQTGDVQPVAAFAVNPPAVVSLAVVPQSGQVAAALLSGGILDAAPDGSQVGGATLGGRLARAVEAGDGLTFAAAQDMRTDTATNHAYGRADVWVRRADGAWADLVPGDDVFDSTAFWDLALDGSGRLWAALDAHGLYRLDHATSEAPGPWAPVRDAELQNQTVVSVAVDPVDTRLVYAGIGASPSRPATAPADRFGLRMSTDGGSTWTGYPGDGRDDPGIPWDRRTPFRTTVVNSVAAGPGGGIVWASAWGDGLFVRTAPETPWQRLTLPPGTTPYFDVLSAVEVPGACRLLFASGKDGLWVRDIADVLRFERTIYLPFTIGAPWDMTVWPPPSLDRRDRAPHDPERGASAR